MFRFEEIDYLYALAAIPILFILFWFILKFKGKQIEKFASSDLYQKLVPSFSKYREWIKFSLLMLALGLLIVSWANPQWGSKREKVSQKSIDVFVALDISKSMNSRDIKPSRLERAKRFASKLIEELKGERIGLILFAGNAYLQMPLTNDYAAAGLFVNSANSNMAPAQGTAIVDAIDMAEESFGEENEFHKAMIIITDGENHDEEALARAKEANENGLVIYTIGVGTTKGGFIPVQNPQGYNEYKKDERGQFVTSKLNEELLNELAISGDGSYYHINDGDQIFPDIEAKINQLEKKEYEQRSFKEYNSYFQYFLLFGILFLILEFILSNRKNKWLRSDDILKV